MKTAVLLLVLGLLLVLFAYVQYQKVSTRLTHVKEEDLVSYYLDLISNMIPVPLWSALIGIALFLVGLIMILVHIPWTI